MDERIVIVVNGSEEHIKKGASVSDLLQLKSIESARVVVEVNRFIVKRDGYCSHILNDNDRIEILRFVGGG